MQQTNQTTSDAILALRCQLGDHAAWEALVRRWHPRLARFVSKMLADPQATDDVLQNIWLRVLRSLLQLRDPQRFSAWVYSMARRAVVDQLRAAYRRPERSETPPDVPDWDEAAARDEAVETIDAALHELTPVDREAIVLFYLEGLSVADVAEACAVPAGTIKSRLHRARQHMRRTLHD